MNDTWIIAITAIGFPLFGLGVFFFWRYKYGVWSPRFREKHTPPGDVRVIRIDEPRGIQDANQSREEPARSERASGN